MPELLLTPIARNRFADGDVIGGATWLDIRSMHASRLCDRYTAPTNTDGWLVPGTLAEHWMRNVCEFRYERISQFVIRQIRQADEQVIGERAPRGWFYASWFRRWGAARSGLPSRTVSREDPHATAADREAGISYTQWRVDMRPGAPYHSDVPDVLEYRRRHRKSGRPKKPVFGTAGREIWYGGRTIITHARLDTIWARIEAERGARDIDYPTVGLSLTQLKLFLAVPIPDMTQAQRAAWTAPHVRTRSVWISEVTPIDKRTWDVQLSVALPAVPDLLQDSGQTRLKVRREITPGVYRVEAHAPPQTGSATAAKRVALRKHRLSWRNWISQLGASESDVLDLGRAVELRGASPLPHSTIETKS